MSSGGTRNTFTRKGAGNRNANVPSSPIDDGVLALEQYWFSSLVDLVLS
jgi:hypothetical protein